MSMKEFVETGGSVLLIVLTLVQVAPIRINPWSAIARTIGKALNADLNEKNGCKRGENCPVSHPSV